MSGTAKGAYYRCEAFTHFSRQRKPTRWQNFSRVPVGEALLDNGPVTEQSNNALLFNTLNP